MSCGVWHLFVFLCCHNAVYTNGLTCYHCQDISHPRFCSQVQQCDDGQVCSLKSISDGYGEKSFHLGCMTAQNCDIKPLSTDTGKCYHCCSSDLCNNAGCGEQDHLETNGSVCYQCNGKLQSEACHHVKFCDFDESCFLSEESRFGEKYYSSGCQDKNLCHSIQYPYPVVGKRSVEREQCCDDDLCNNYRLKSPQTQIQQTTTPKVYTTTTDIARKFKDCTELNRNTQNSSGVYQIYPMGKNAEGVPAYCDLKTDGGGWTLIQRRFDGSVDFQRTWVECENGFGNVNGELWLGNKFVHLLTSGGHYELRIDLTDDNNGKRYAVYSTFIVGDSASKYNLTVSGYSGNAGDDRGQNFLYHNGKVFTTIDQKNDRFNKNCAKLFKGPWWYDNCYGSCNLNREYSTKMVWNAHDNIVQSVMMIREQ